MQNEEASHLHFAITGYIFCHSINKSAEERILGVLSVLPLRPKHLYTKHHSMYISQVMLPHKGIFNLSFLCALIHQEKNPQTTMESTLMLLFQTVLLCSMKEGLILWPRLLSAKVCIMTPGYS